MILNKLYTESDTEQLISPITFYSGLNIISGEKDESSNKRNGVGKSLCIDFINFALLKKKSECRLSKIPNDIYDPNTTICLDFTIGNDHFTIKRSIKNSTTPIIIENGKKTTFENLEHALLYMKAKLFKDKLSTPSFREILSILIRDERSEFKSIIKCHDTDKRVPDNYSPHLYLLGIGKNIYENIRAYIKNIDDIKKNLKSIKEDLYHINQSNMDDLDVEIRKLEIELTKIKDSIDKLENTQGYEIVKEDLLRIEAQMETLRTDKAITKSKLNRMVSLPHVDNIDVEEIEDFYSSINSRLGEFIKKDLLEVVKFKETIIEFQNNIIEKEKKSLISEIDKLDKELNSLDKQYSINLSVLNQNGELKNLKQTYDAHIKKSEQLSRLKILVDNFHELESQKNKTNIAKEQAAEELKQTIKKNQKGLEDFDKTIRDMHEYIQQGITPFFTLKYSTKKQIIEIELRIDSDGSHSINREKVFLYDMALLLNEHTRKRHPGFLIHDNIFEVDQDTLQKNLNFLIDKANLGDSQYILTLNSDRIDICEGGFKNKLEPFIRAKFTKSDRFLKKKYQEI